MTPYLTLATTLLLLVAFVALVGRSRHDRLLAGCACAFALALLTITLTNLYRALGPQFGEDAPWAFAAVLLTAALAPLTSYSIRRLRRSRRTGSSS